MDEQGQVKAKREAAARARRLAVELTMPADRDRVLAFAADLEAQADALRRAPIAPGQPVTQTQMQMQQGPPAKDGDQYKS